MKKLLMIGLCLILVGCGTKVTEAPVTIQEKETLVEDKIGWVGEYVNDDLKLVIMYHSDNYQEGFEFNIEFISTGTGIAEFARYVDDTKLEAICDVEQDGYPIRFTLDGDKVKVEETGIGYLNTDLSGIYVRKQVNP